MPSGPRAGTDVNWRVLGHGPRPAIGLHCSLAHSGALKALGECLADRLSLTAFDMPGHGRSADWSGEGPLQHRVVAIARSFLEEHDEPVDLIGHSFGGTSLLRLAAEHSARVRSLTLIEPPFYDALKVPRPAAYEAQLELDGAFAAAQTRGERETAAREFTNVWGAEGGWASLNDTQKRYIIDRIHLIEGAGLLLNADYAGLLEPGGLEAIAVPALLLRGDLSPPSMPAVAEVLAARMPDATVEIVEGAGHMLPITHPAETAEAIGRLLSRT